MTFFIPCCPPSPLSPPTPDRVHTRENDSCSRSFETRHEVTRIGWKISYEMEGNPLGCCITVSSVNPKGIKLHNFNSPSCWRTSLYWRNIWIRMLAYIRKNYRNTILRSKNYWNTSVWFRPPVARQPKIFFLTLWNSKRPTSIFLTSRRPFFRMHFDDLPHQLALELKSVVNFLACVVFWSDSKLKKICNILFQCFFIEYIFCRKDDFWSWTSLTLR